MGGSLDPDAFFDLFLDDLRPPDGDEVPGSGDDRVRCSGTDGVRSSGDARVPRPGSAGVPRLGNAAAWRSWWREAALTDPDAAVTGFVLSGGEVAARGLTRAQARTAIRRGRWQAAGRGMVAPVEVSREAADAFIVARREHALSAAAASRRRPREVIAGRSAAILHGLPTVRVPVEPELLLARGVGAGRLPSGHLYSAACAPTDTTSWFGRPVTTVPRTLVDLARHDRFDAIMAVDAALREGMTTQAEIRSALSTAIGWPGVRQARAVLELADPRAESPLESVTRLRVHDENLPAPELQAWIGPHRVDFYWPRWRLVLEADGRVKYTADERWAEKKREQALRRAVPGLRVERVVWADVLDGWLETARLLRSILS